MSIEPKTMYTVVCDNCRTDAFEGHDTVAWDSPGSASDMAVANHDFIRYKGGKHYCPDCWGWNEDETEAIPKEKL